MINNFETAFYDGAKTFYYDYEPYKLTIRTTSYLIRVVFETQLTREWLTKILAPDFNKITEHEFTLYLKYLSHHISKGCRYVVIRTYDNKIIDHRP